MALVAHLRRDFRALRLARELPRFGDRPRQRLLDVHVLAEIHRGQRDGGVHVIRRRDDDGVDVLLLLEHLPVVLVARGARQMFVAQAFHALDFDGHALPLNRRQRRFGPTLCVEARLVRRSIEPLLLVLDRRVESGEPAIRVLPVHVAHRDDVLGREVDQIGSPLSADADGGDVERVAGRGEPAAEHVSRDDRQPGACERDLCEEIASCVFGHDSSYRSSRILMLRKASVPAWSPCNAMRPRVASP